MSDPYYVHVATADLDALRRALRLVDEHAELNHRYRKLITDSLADLDAERVRLTQARGIAKKLMVLLNRAGSEFRDRLDADESAALEAGITLADDLVQDRQR